MMALGFEDGSTGTQTVGEIAVIAIQGVDQAPEFPATVDCFIPAAGIAQDPSLAPDAGKIAWKDDGGVKVAGTPSTDADPCAMGSAPAVISATGTHPSIGGADVAAFLPKQPTTQQQPPASPGSGVPATTGASGSSGATTPLAPVAKVPAKMSVRALARARCVPVKVKVGGPGKVSVRGTVPARRVGRRGKPVVVATGSRSAKAAGTVTVRLRLTAVGRKRASRLKGARLTLRIKHASRSTTRVVRLR
jgi:hypothetical protein